MPDLVTPWGLLALWAAAGYLTGAIPFGVLLARALGLGDLRRIGSGNIGATNMLRTGNRGAALVTLVLDAGKGAAPVLLARALTGEDAAQVAALAAFLGHVFPVWLGFRGGKGVATFLGLTLALAWPVGVAACLTWAAAAAVGRYSSMAALLAAALAPGWAFVLDEGRTIGLLFVLTAVIYWAHRGNIARLRAGTEPRIGRRA